MCVDPCGVCKLVRWIFTIAIIFVVCGYLGKGVYLYGGAAGDLDGKSLTANMKEDHFWAPDGLFFFFGLAFGLTLLVFLLVLRSCTTRFSKMLKRACCLGWCFDEDMHLPLVMKRGGESVPMQDYHKLDDLGEMPSLDYSPINNNRQ